jgi:hypothetical protein
MSSSSAPSLNQFCWALTANPNSQMSCKELTEQRTSTLIYLTQASPNPPPPLNTMYKAPFPSQAARIAYRKARQIALGKKGPLPSQNAPVEISLLQAWAADNAC